MNEAKQREAQDQLLRAKQQSAAVILQKLFRSFRVRKNIKSWKKERLHYLYLRRNDEVIRRNRWYRFLLALGMAPSLKSDTATEFVLKQFPWYLSQTIVDCVQQDWEGAAEKGGWKRKRVVINTQDGFQALRTLMSAKFRLRKLTRELQQRLRALVTARQQYREVGVGRSTRMTYKMQPFRVHFSLCAYVLAD